MLFSALHISGEIRINHTFAESHKHKKQREAKNKKQIGKIKCGGVLGKKGDYTGNGEKLKSTYIYLIT